VIALQQEFRKQFENDFKREFDQKVVWKSCRHELHLWGEGFRPTVYECVKSWLAYRPSPRSQHVGLAAICMYDSQVRGKLFENVLPSGLNNCTYCTTQPQTTGWYVLNFATKQHFIFLERPKCIASGSENSYDVDEP
jgi:hypothetical protein